MQAVLDRLRDDGVVHRHLDGAAGQRLGARDDLRECRDEEIVRAHPLQVRRHSLAVPRPVEEESALRVPSPARLEERGLEDGLDEDLARGGGIEVVEDFRQLEAVLRAERKDDCLFVRGRLELEAEADAEALPQREPPGLVDLRAERRVNDELHPAALVEEALEDHTLLRGDAAERLPSGFDVLGDLDGGALGQGVSAFEREKRRFLRMEERDVSSGATPFP